MQTPTIGRIVMVKGYSNRGTDEHPAIVNFVYEVEKPNEFGEQAYRIDCTVFPRGAAPFHVETIDLVDTRTEAAELLKKGVDHSVEMVAFWPPRV